MKIQKWLVAGILSGIFSTTVLSAGEKLETGAYRRVNRAQRKDE